MFGYLQVLVSDSLDFSRPLDEDLLFNQPFDGLLDSLRVEKGQSPKSRMLCQALGEFVLPATVSGQGVDNALARIARSGGALHQFCDDGVDRQ